MTAMIDWKSKCFSCGHTTHADTDCDEVIGYDHLNGDLECGCPGEGPVVADARAEALRDAADAWQQGQWADVLLPATKNPIDNGQRVTDWLRARAQR